VVAVVGAKAVTAGEEWTLGSSPSDS